MVVSPVHQVWSNHLARHGKRGKKTRQTKEEVGRQHQGMDRPGVRQVPEGSGEQAKNGENWLQNYLWCPNDPCGSGIDDGDNEIHSGDTRHTSLIIIRYIATIQC